MRNAKLFVIGLIMSIIGLKFVENFWFLGVMGLELMFFGAIFVIWGYFKKGITIKIIDPNDRD